MIFPLFLKFKKYKLSGDLVSYTSICPVSLKYSICLGKQRSFNHTEISLFGLRIYYISLYILHICVYIKHTCIYMCVYVCVCKPSHTIFLKVMIQALDKSFLVIIENLIHAVNAAIPFRKLLRKALNQNTTNK